jgi:hypothetical protein
MAEYVKIEKKEHQDFLKANKERDKRKVAKS